MVAEASVSAVVAGYGIQRQPERQAATDPPCSGGWPRDMMARRGNERGTIMGMYLTKFSHTHETWARLLANPEDRRAVLGPAVEAAGGKLHGYWYAFGDADGFVLIEARRCHGRGPPRQGGLHGGVHKCFDHQAAHGRRSTRCPAPGRRRRVPRSRRSRKLISGLLGSRPLDAGFPDRNSLGRHPTCCGLWSAVRLVDFPQSDSARRTGGSARPARGASRQPTRTYSALRSRPAVQRPDNPITTCDGHSANPASVFALVKS